ncbi:anthranilate phosphoribosyltransferase [Alkalibaculum sp. M08DMB]|uniref:Anthranilate phosphoribosyltransferase n=1 Tax=Alkalibaculum sporogenes TaxID=2655001 RepID=A0A6A7KBC8_9FIRM|nr:anthranilate phosphoribosyltransferase [Alkalibaculum sporogenes]MPW26714.1 anthranilate phosphoribosyltransferase [Alkalibaculum sporogenes]
MLFKEILEKLVNHINLTEMEMMDSMNSIMLGEITPAQIGGFLTGLRGKGETLEEVLGAAKVMRKMAKPIDIGVIDAVDTCGTGGDGKNTFNVSTVSAIVAASAGVTTVKHGNRSISSKCGSADVLEALGVKIDLSSENISSCIREIGIGFLFAQSFHSSMKHVASSRKELGIRTVFNMLGPLTNPAKVNCQVMGVYDAALTELMAGVLKELGVKRAMVVNSLDGMDEISISAKTKATILIDGDIKTHYIEPKTYGFYYENNGEIEGNGSIENAQIILNILEGESGPKRDITLINAGAAIYIGNGAKSLEEGILKAKEAVDSKSALNKLNELIAYTNRSE